MPLSLSDAERAAKVNAQFEKDLSCLRLDGDILYVEKGLVPNMRIPGKVYIGNTSYLPALHQIGNAAALPGAVGYSIGLPDIHCGYGFAIGHVAAFDVNDPEAIVSPGGVGFDINCGVRMLRTNLLVEDVRPFQEKLADAIYDRVPVGVGGRNEVPLELAELRDLMMRGMAWAVEKGFAWREDEERCEERGCVAFDRSVRSFLNQRAEARGMPQLGTLGSGNHYIEVQAVTDIYDEAAAAAMGISNIGQICIMVHCGSRGFGHQIADDAIRAMKKAMARDEITINDPMLACARIHSPEGQLYLAQMAAASNFAYVNRSIIAHRIREAFSDIFGRSARDLDMHLVYDVAHNIAKQERHDVLGVEKTLLVHRKGSTRAFPPGHPDLPEIYKDIGQPVLVGGSMGTCSYVLTGTEKGMRETFGSTCHGAGRVHGRHEMKRLLRPDEVISDLQKKGITLRASSVDNIAEEAPSSYKDVTAVVDICHGTGISKKALKLEPVCVIKG